MSITSTQVREWISAYAAEIAEHEAEELVHRDDLVGTSRPDRDAEQDEQHARHANGHVGDGDGCLHGMTLT